MGLWILSRYFVRIFCVLLQRAKGDFSMGFVGLLLRWVRFCCGAYIALHTKNSFKTRFSAVFFVCFVFYFGACFSLKSLLAVYL